MLEVEVKQEKVNQGVQQEKQQEKLDQGAVALLAQKEVKFAMNELLSWQISLPSVPALSTKKTLQETLQRESLN